MSFSRNPTTVLDDALQKGYARVRFQQGSPVLDRELNLLGDLASPTRLADQYVGNGVPTGSNGFSITNLNIPSNDFTIEAGRALVGGHEVELRANTTYRTQPNNRNAAPLPLGTSNIYLRVFTRPITEADDADLGNTGPGDVGRVTAVREMVDFEVLVSRPVINARDHLLLASLDVGELNRVIDRRRVDLTVASLRDEVSNARGSAATLDARLDASLTETGALRANAVGTTQVVNASVTTAKLAAAAIGTAQLALNAVGTTQLANNAITELKLADNAVSRRAVAGGAISIAKMSLTPVVDQQISIIAAPAVGQSSDTVVTIQNADEHAFYLVSVRQIAPRTPALPIQAISLPFNWMHRVLTIKRLGQTQYEHIHQLVFQNFSTTAQTVAYRVYRLDET